ncbi:CLUMA_CG007497, isoform A [Clunio marinus]|uniref:CLUMA_CG007497, isoform A n=1 Tax=Clunio marinus TaxID=568069 RepID=A0A1J1I191_9DIPT|nr:CLUMA_CG007497, isoform A [Clunio marinus]
MTQEDSKNLKRYFENDPPSFFDELTEKEVDEVSIKLSSEVKDLWPYPNRDEAHPIVPRVIVESLNDPIVQAISNHFPSEIEKRKQANKESLTMDDRGIKTLINEKCYREAVALTSRLLTNYGQGTTASATMKHSTHSLQLWHTRLALLIKINELDIAKQEAEAFGQLSSPDLFYEHQSPQNFKSKYGSMASFSFRLLLAGELPLKLNKPHDALKNLLNILEVTEKIYNFFIELKKENEAEFWKDRKIRVQCLMINCAAYLKKFDLAHQLYESIRKLPNLNEKLRMTLASSWGRTFLLCGDIKSAEEKFKLCEAKANSHIVQTMIDQGLIAVAQNSYEEALQIFQKAHELEKENILILNNIAVCYLYTGRMHNAIKIYEQAINFNPKQSINEAVLLNCATLYELESNEAKKKKLDLLKLVSANRADLEVSIEACLKL